MTSSEAALTLLFLGERGCNITFVLDTSENTRAVLESVKRLLIQTLLTKASLRDSLFNIMTFSAKVDCWSHHMFSCTPDTVYTALSWIHSISCSPGRDLLAALSMALTDPACQAVHLLIADLPDQPEAVLRALPTLAAGRPVNVFYLQDSAGRLHHSSREYLQCLSRTTRGSCFTIPVDSNGVLQKLIPLYVGDSQSSLPNVSLVNCCCPSTSVLMPQLHDTSSPLLRCSLCNLHSPVTSCISTDSTLTSSEFFPGCRVLARREMDGFYYLGTVIHQVQGRRGLWVVEFVHPGSTGLGVVSSKQQLVCSLDMLNHTRAQTHRLVPGDAVLSPWEPDRRRYGPGRVMAATEHRESFADGMKSLRVLMWNGCVSLVPDSLVLPISACHHDRIVRELQIPTPALTPSCSWLCARSSSCTPRLFRTDYCRSASAACCSSVTNAWSCMVPPSCGSGLGKMDGLDRVEQDKQVDLTDTDVLKSDPEVPCSSFSYPPEEETKATFPPAVKLRSKNQQRPPWRYWCRTRPEPQHRLPGSAAPRRPTPPARSSFPLPQASTSPNHSSLFQALPGAKGRRANIREVIGTTKFKP